ncbi:MAG: penicillin-binding transpeptidase domain-containing protein [Synergistaceae bacterium]|nr:penicillin-binding transpeptidase domain-containing protein [Synergistaceae bacterium]
MGIDKGVRIRMLALLFIFTFAILALAIRVGYLQFIQGESLSEMAFRQQNLGMDISPKRGAILDRNGDELAVNVPVETLTISPNEIRKSILDNKLTKDEVVRMLADTLGLDRDSVADKLDKDSIYEILIKKIDKQLADEVRESISQIKLRGVYFTEDTKRFYQNKNLAAHVIGATGVDNQGLSGIEFVMEEYIKGVPGKIMGEVDAKNREVPLRREERVEPQDGYNVVLTIDSTIQYYATKALEKAIEENDVRRGGVIIIMDPKNGDILALVSKPDFDLNDPFAPPPGYFPDTWNGRSAEGVEILNSTVWRNKAIMDTYEPGSTFKAITASAGLEEGTISLDSTFVCKPFVGYYSKPINCWTTSGSHGTQDLTHAVYNSCNPAFMRIALSVGVDAFYRYVRDFGFYDKTDISLPGETRGIFQAQPKELDMLVASFGQRFTVTPIQMITAYAAVANGGSLMKPRLIKELTDSDGNVVMTFNPETIRKVISKETSEELRTILEGVVTEGTGRNAYVSGFRVAGKTGTSETVDAGRYIASFCSFAPADNPAICALIMLDEPMGEEYMGGAIAAPVAQMLFEDILTYLKIEREYTERDRKALIREALAPEVRGMSVSEATKTLKDAGLDYKVIGEKGETGKKVAMQMPPADSRIPLKSTIFLYTEKSDEPMMVAVPDLQNKTVYEATETLKRYNLNIRINGLGVAKSQSVQPDVLVAEGSIIEVSFIYTDNIE